MSASNTALRAEPQIVRVSQDLVLPDGIDARRCAGLEEDCGWLAILRNAFGHEPILLIALQNGEYAGHLALCSVESKLFGRFLVSLPFINSAGVRAVDSSFAAALIGRAVELADDIDVRFLELRHEQAIDHPALTETMSHKVHMRLALPNTSDELMTSLKSKRRSQLKNGLKRDFEFAWGGEERLGDFYRVFSRNMRDLGTPVYSKALFREILTQHGAVAELCCAYDGARPIAAALLIHGAGTTEVPSASSLREYNPSNVNMAMYWHLLTRAIDRGQATFDFGRSTIDGSTFAFKKQWGATPSPANWQYHVRHGTINAARPDNTRYNMAIRLWKRLPLAIANQLGPRIVRGIP